MLKKSKIKSIKAKEIFDSNRKPTVEVELKTDFGVFQASVPSGLSRGKYEAVELRDKDGGVKKAIENIEKVIAPALKTEDSTNQRKIDEILIQLDGTKNKSRLGANSILAVSLAVCRAGSKARNLPLYLHISQLMEIGSPSIKLPTPCFNLIEGGRHAKGGLLFQEFMVVPQKKNFGENLKTGQKAYQELKKILETKFGKENIKLTAEGAFSPPLEKISQALDLILAVVEKTGEKDKIKIAIDVAASEFFKEGRYQLENKIFSREELSKFHQSLTEKYPIISIEDPFFEEDFESFALLKKEIGDKVIIFGDDLTVSKIERMRLAESQKACFGLILKPNQIGTVTETIEVAKLAKKFHWKIMVSNRAGETEDDFIADLAVGIGADFIKSGAPFPKERMAKYNRLLAIEKEINRDK